MRASGEQSPGATRPPSQAWSSNSDIGSRLLKSWLAIVARARWLVMFPRTSLLATPALRQSVGMSEWLMNSRGMARARFAGLARYFGFYNTRRRHSALDRRTPDAVYFDQAHRDLAA